MFRFGWIARFLLTLLLVAVIIGGGYSLYRFGWAQGYQAGAVTVAAPNQGTTPQSPAPYYGFPPYHFYGPGYGFPFFFPFFPLVGIGFFLLFFFLIGSLFRFGAYRHWHGYGGPGWGRPEEKQGPDQPQGPGQTAG